MPHEEEKPVAFGVVKKKGVVQKKWKPKIKDGEEVKNDEGHVVGVEVPKMYPIFEKGKENTPPPSPKKKGSKKPKESVAEAPRRSTRERKPVDRLRGTEKPGTWRKK